MAFREFIFEFNATHKETGETKVFEQSGTWRYGALEKLQARYKEWYFDY